VPDHATFIDDVLAGPLAGSELQPTELDAQLGRGPNGLMVAPAPTGPERADCSTKPPTAPCSIGFAGSSGHSCSTAVPAWTIHPRVRRSPCADQLVLVCDDEPDTQPASSQKPAQ